jgi:SAM-dependent methyltransferase
MAEVESLSRHHLFALHPEGEGGGSCAGVSHRPGGGFLPHGADTDSFAEDTGRGVPPVATDSMRDEYDAKYSMVSLSPSPYFLRQFDYVRRWAEAPSAGLLLDLGGGTGEYALALQEAGHDVVLNDISATALEKARAIGVREVDGSDLLADPPAGRFACILAKGLSPLNTDDAAVFHDVIGRIRSMLAPDGVAIVWGVSDMTGTWSASGWYNWHPRQLRAMAGDTLSFPALRHQVWFPLAVNRAVSAVAERRRWTRMITTISLLRP